MDDTSRGAKGNRRKAAAESDYACPKERDLEIGRPGVFLKPNPEL
jgi:hypothetical protein